MLFKQMAKCLPFLEALIPVVDVRDRVADVIARLDEGSLRGKALEKAIEDFTLEDLARVSDDLIAHYARKCETQYMNSHLPRRDPALARLTSLCRDKRRYFRSCLAGVLE
jgi:hypothetical protein